MKDRIRLSCMIACLAVLIFIASTSLSYAEPKVNPPGPKGGPGAGLHRGRGVNPPGPKGGPGAGLRRDRDNNPPGPAGGRGTNWENPPGPRGGPGAGPDNNLKEKAVVDKGWERRADTNNDGIVDEFEINQWKNRRRDRDNNPPGPAGGQGTDWENPPGPRGGPGAGPDKRRAANPPGPKGGPGAGPRVGGKR